MTINTQDMIGSILESISRIDYIKPEDIPNINLYMDQVTTFMEEQLASSKRYPEDKILTKTMINNYAKKMCIRDRVKFLKHTIIKLYHNFPVPVFHGYHKCVRLCAVFCVKCR